jgi:hypothetical protein
MVVYVTKNMGGGVLDFCSHIFKVYFLLNEARSLVKITDNFSKIIIFTPYKSNCF